MTKLLDIIESYLEQLGHKACRIDGSVHWQERQQNISSFNEDEVCVYQCVYVCPCVWFCVFVHLAYTQMPINCTYSQMPVN